MIHQMRQSSMSVLFGGASRLPFHGSAERRPAKTLQARNSFSLVFHGALNGVPPIIVKIADRPVESFVVRANAQLVTADFAKVLKWNVARAQRRHRLFEIFRRDGYDDP